MEVVGAELRMAPVGRFGHVFVFNEKLPMVTELDAADTLDMSIGIWIVGGVCDTLADHFYRKNTSKLSLASRFVWDQPDVHESGC
jgi:hypothetical protein